MSNGIGTDVEGTLVVRAGRLIDGTGAEPRRDVTLIIERGVIARVGGPEERPRGATVLDLGEYTVLPGLINMHTHTVLPGDGTPFEAWMERPDELFLLQAATNARTALESGVTTLRDCGGKGRLMFRLRDAIRAGIVPGPRLVLSGRPLTITGGHCRHFGGEADGPGRLRHAARELLKEGADFIKLMASGGGTVGTYPQYPAFDLDELRAAIGEAHKIGKPASCHCTAAASIGLALDAGTDHIEHCYFMAPDLTLSYDEVLARRVATAGVYVTATLQVGADALAGMKDRQARGVATPDEERRLAQVPDPVTVTLDTTRALHELGVPIVAGNDAGWRFTGFDDFWQELQWLTRAGLTALGAIHAATGLAARACQLDGVTGTLAAGLAADLLAVPGDPAHNLAALATPALVLQAGRIVVDRR